LLAEDRAAGFAFEEVVRRRRGVCGTLGKRPDSWREALLGTRRAWQACWDDQPGPRSQVTLDLADDTCDSVQAGGVAIG